MPYLNSNSHHSSRVGIILSIACLIGGLMAGTDIFRYVIEVPAWRHLNILTWKEYSLHADLGNGTWLFPAEAIGSALPLLICSLIIIRNKNTNHSFAIPVHLATIFALLGLGFTFFAAPYMLHIPETADDPMVLQQTFNSFHFWGTLRAIVQVLSFCACTWALYRIKTK